MKRKIMAIILALMLVSAAYAATRSLVPRADGEGSLGTSSKYWGSAYIEALIMDGFDVIHTATMNDDHAVEIEVDAAGYGDVKALDIVYTTGTISAGEDEGVILVNIDEIAATGGEVYGIEILSTEDGSATVYGLKVGASIGLLHQDSGTFVNPTTGTDNTTSTDVAAMIDGSSGTTTTIFEADNEYILIGAASVFQEIEVILTTGASGGGIAPTFGYSISGAHTFTAFSPVDGTNGFKNTGIIAWDAGDLTSHTTNNNTSTYDILITRTRNSLSTDPVLGYAKVASTTEYTWDNTGAVDVLSMEADTITEGGQAVWNTTETEIIDSDHYVDASIDLVHLASGVYAKDLVTTSPITGAADNIFVGADSDVTVAITMLKDLVTTAPVTGGTNDIFPGADADITVALDFTAAWDFGGATSLEIPNAADPDVDAAGEISNDTDGANETGDVIVRGFDGTNQFPVGQKLKTLNFTLVSPDTIDAADLIPVWHNTSGMTFTIVEWKAWSDDDNVSLEIEELTDQTDYTAITTVDAVEIATDGTGVFYASDGTITHGAIEHDHSLAIDFDTADTPDYVQIAITGWFNADVD